MTLLELLIIFFVGIAVLASAVGAWARRRETSASRARRDDRASGRG
jgi:hypothetical protein